MKKLVLAFGILVSALSVGMAMSEYEWGRAVDNCLNNGEKSACQELIDNGLPSVEECTKYDCYAVGLAYHGAGHNKEAILYLEKAIALGENIAFGSLGQVYYELNDYFNAQKYYEIGCNKVSVSGIQSASCYNLGVMYYNGKGVRQDYNKARELYKKACDIKDAQACYNLGVLYGKGQGVKQNRSIAKQYFGKACDLGEQTGCDNYKKLIILIKEFDSQADI